ncbi:MAG: prepilin-type N-terminal cleavage/methylation domain-containing protein [Planctomycetota bacterium]|nr:prepilin-type N-terminal cleavage/methylation domain-containing protein [Planctomycetota bacterium]
MVRRGFTLIEIMIVVAIIALLMTLTISVVGRVGHASKVRTCKAMMKDLERAAHSYKSVFGSYPRDYLENFSYLSSDSGSQEEQIRYK